MTGFLGVVDGYAKMSQNENITDERKQKHPRGV